MKPDFKAQAWPKVGRAKPSFRPAQPMGTPNFKAIAVPKVVHQLNWDRGLMGLTSSFLFKVKEVSSRVGFRVNLNPNPTHLIAVPTSKKKLGLS